MDPSALANLVDPAIVFFILGIVVALVRSNLEIPPALVKFFSLYLLMAIGFKGGRELAATGLDEELVRALLAAVILAVAVPAVSFLVLRRRVPLFDAAAIAATYGSVSAVTFIAASSFLTRQGTEFSGAMTVALVVMESPAIIMAVFLAAWVRANHPGQAGSGSPVVLRPTGAPASNGGGPASIPATPAPAGGATVPVLGAAATTATEAEEEEQETAAAPLGLRAVLHEAFTDGAHLLLIGSMVVGALSTDEGAAAMAPFTEGLFKGILAFFLLEMGLLVARELRRMRSIGGFLIAYGLVMPLVAATLAVGLAYALGMGAGNAVLLTVLAASASYIVVPAVVRYAIPEALPSRYFGLALGVTFPFNIVVGIPLYHAVVTALW